MKTRVVITVDTEASIAGHYAFPEQLCPLIHEPVSGVVMGKSEALGFIIRTLVKYDLIGTFFVETLQEHYFQQNEMQAYVHKLVEAGQDVQLHLHPTWLNFANGIRKGVSKISDHCYDLNLNELVDAISKGCDLLESWSGCRPTSMRTGNFSTSMNVYTAAARCGLRTASNLNLSAHIPKEEKLRISGGIAKLEGIWEFPVTNFSDIGPVGQGRARALQITALSFAEQVRLLNKINEESGAVAVIITHPFEFIKKDNSQYEGMTRNSLVQGRFEKLCAYFRDNSDRFEVVPMADLGKEEERAEPALNLNGNSFLAFMRAASNFINDHI